MAFGPLLLLPLLSLLRRKSDGGSAPAVLTCGSADVLRPCPLSGSPFAPLQVTSCDHPPRSPCQKCVCFGAMACQGSETGDGKQQPSARHRVHAHMLNTASGCGKQHAGYVHGS